MKDIQRKNIPFVLSVIFIIFCTSVIGQTKTFRGKVIDAKTNKGIGWAKIIRLDSLVETSSDDKGKFVMLLPRKGSQGMVITHPEYKPVNILATPQMKLKPENVIRMSSLVSEQTRILKATDTSWYEWKNNISLAPIDLFNLTITLSYERFLNNLNSVGLYTSIYIKSKLWLGGSYDKQQDPRMRGFQIAPFYRYYMKKGSNKGVFAQAKLIGGYYSLVEWHNSNDEWSEITDFFTAGFGAAIGVKLFHGQARHNTFEFSVGFKYLPIPVSSAENEFWNEVAQNAGGTPFNGWYGFFGPGSVVDFKFTIGGLF